MKEPKYIIAFDTAMSACSAALYNTETDQTLAAKHEPMNRGQAERLVPMIGEVIKEAGIEYKDLDLIACTHGPGAFTGLRVALSTAKALSLSLGIPAIGISTLEAVLHSALKSVSPIIDGDANSYMSCLETKRRDYYVQVFDKDKKSLTPPESLPLKEVEIRIQEYTPIIYGDSAIERLKEERGKPLKTKRIHWINCSELAKLAKAKFYFSSDHSESLKPVYLRDADVSFPATKK